MIKYLLFFSFWLTCISQLAAQKSDALTADYFRTSSKEAYLSKLLALPINIKATDAYQTIFSKAEQYLISYQPDTAHYADDFFAKMANLEAVKSILEGGYGIGAILLDSTGSIIARGHNRQIQEKRSDLHGEMDLLTKFELSEQSSYYRNGYRFSKKVLVFSSAEPCPMCLIRLASAGTDTRFCTAGPDDAMTDRIDCLPMNWQTLIRSREFAKGKTSPIMQQFSHLLFYSFYLHN